MKTGFPLCSFHLHGKTCFYYRDGFAVCRPLSYGNIRRAELCRCEIGKPFFNPNWHEGDTFLSLSFLDQILTAEFLSKILTELKKDINRINLIPCWAHLVLQKMPIDGSKDVHFSCFHSSCQWGLSQSVSYFMFIM